MKKIHAIGILVGLSLLVSCASTKVEGTANENTVKTEKTTKKKTKKVAFSEEGYVEAIKSGDYDTALGMLESLEKPDVAKLLDKGMLQFYAKDYASATSTIESSTQMMDALMPDSLKAGAGSLATSDYTGNTYEYLLVDAFNSLAYYQLGDIDSAYSRLVRVGDKQREYMVNYGEVIAREEKQNDGPNVSAETQKELEEALAAAGLSGFAIGDVIRDINNMKLPRKATRADVYDTSAFVDYLQIVLAAQNGSYVDDYVVRELSETLKKGSEVVTSADLKPTEGRIEVLALTNAINTRSSDKMSINLDSLVRMCLEMAAVSSAQDGKIDIAVLSAQLSEGDRKIGYNINYPVVTEKNESVPTVKKITLNNSVDGKVILLEDFDKAVQMDVDLKARKSAKANIGMSLLQKTPIIPVQVATFYASALAAYTAYDTAVATAASLPSVLLADKAIIKATEIRDNALEGAKKILIDGLDNVDPKADVRQSKALPSKAYCAGFTVEPGTYSITVTYSNGKKEEINNIVVKAGKPVLVESSSAWAK